MNKKLLWNVSAIFMVVLLSICFVSCGKEDADGDGQNDELVEKLQGEWSFFSGKETVNGMTITIDQNFLDQMKSMMGSGITIWDETLKFDGNKLNGIKYTLKNNQIIMEGMDDFKGFTITVKSITSSTLVLHETISVEGMDIVADMEYHKE